MPSCQNGGGSAPGCRGLQAEETLPSTPPPHTCPQAPRPPYPKHHQPTAAPPARTESKSPGTLISGIHTRNSKPNGAGRQGVWGYRFCSCWQDLYNPDWPNGVPGGAGGGDDKEG